jgi:hypothetical protein
MKYQSVDQVKKILSQNPGLRINNHRVEVIIGSPHVGNGTWGKLDYLQKNGYLIDRVQEFSKN